MLKRLTRIAVGGSMLAGLIVPATLHAQTQPIETEFDLGKLSDEVGNRLQGWSAQETILDNENQNITLTPETTRDRASLAIRIAGITLRNARIKNEAVAIADDTFSTIAKIIGPIKTLKSITIAIKILNVALISNSREEFLLETTKILSTEGIKLSNQQKTILRDLFGIAKTELLEKPASQLRFAVFHQYCGMVEFAIRKFDVKSNSSKLIISGDCKGVINKAGVRLYAFRIAIDFKPNLAIRKVQKFEYLPSLPTPGSRLFKRKEIIEISIGLGEIHRAEIHAPDEPENPLACNPKVSNQTPHQNGPEQPKESGTMASCRKKCSTFETILTTQDSKYWQGVKNKNNTEKELMEKKLELENVEADMEKIKTQLNQVSASIVRIEKDIVATNEEIERKLAAGGLTASLKNKLVRLNAALKKANESQRNIFANYRIAKEAYKDAKRNYDNKNDTYQSDRKYVGKIISDTEEAFEAHGRCMRRCFANQDRDITLELSSSKLMPGGSFRATYSGIDFGLPGKNENYALRAELVITRKGERERNPRAISRQALAQDSPSSSPASGGSRSISITAPRRAGKYEARIYYRGDFCGQSFVAAQKDFKVEMCDGASNDATSNGGLGRVWHESESGWKGIWTRDGTTNRFKAVWFGGGGRVTADLTIRRNGNRVQITRKEHASDGTCEYKGEVQCNKVTGTYKCSWDDTGPHAWEADIKH